tara:strand:+ start:24131 stop:24391 length:261 start_codon:yes stop_codon:yes gene_type:complete
MTTAADLQNTFDLVDAATNDDCDMVLQAEEFAILRGHCYRVIAEQVALATASSEEHDEFLGQIRAATDIAAVCSERIDMIDDMFND